MLCLRSDRYRVGRGPLGEYGGWLQYIEYPVIKLKMIIIEYNTHSGTTNRVVPLSGPLGLPTTGALCRGYRRQSKNDHIEYMQIKTDEGWEFTAVDNVNVGWLGTGTPLAWLCCTRGRATTGFKLMEATAVRMSATERWSLMWTMLNKKWFRDQRKK